LITRARKPIALVALLAAGALFGVSRSDRITHVAPASAISHAHGAVSDSGNALPTRLRALGSVGFVAALLAATAVLFAVERRRSIDPARSMRRNANRRGPPLATLI